METERRKGGNMLVQVAAAIIRRNGRYLIAKRKQGVLFGGLWEFPGGKRSDGESLEECLRREIREELGVEVAVRELYHEALYPYPESTTIIYFYNCSIRAGRIKPLGCQEFRWVPSYELPTYSFPPANVPLIIELMGS